jgi:hypothetical protein
MTFSSATVNVAIPILSKILSIPTLSIIKFFVWLGVVMLSVVMLSCRYAECRYAECRYAECRYNVCQHVKCRGAISPACFSNILLGVL